MNEKIILELFYCFLYVLGLTYVLYKVNLNLNFKRCIKLLIIYTFINYLLTDIIIALNVQYLFKNILVFVYDFIYACILTRNKKWIHLIVTTSYYVLYGAFLVIVVGIFSFYLHFSTAEITNTGIIKGIIVAIVVLLTCLSMKIFSILKYFKSNKISFKKVLPFVGLNFLNIVMIMFFLFNFHKPNKDSILSYIFIFIIIQSIFVNYLFAITIKSLNEEKESELFDITSRFNMKLLEDIKQEQEKVNELKHDMKNHLFVLEKFSTSKEASQYIHDIKFDLLTNQTYNTGNIFVDACLNSKISTYVNVDVEVHAHLSNNTPVQDKDMCSLLFNLLDNAFESARNSENKKIILKMLEETNSLVILCENSCDSMPIFKSLKSGGHGHGLNIINKIISKYNGEILTEYVDKKYSVNIYFCICN